MHPQSFSKPHNNPLQSFTSTKTISSSDKFTFKVPVSFIAAYSLNKQQQLVNSFFVI